MMVVHIEPEAEADLAAIRIWYDSQRIGLGDDFLDEFEGVSRQIAEFPSLYRTTLEDARQAPLRRFPYYIFYVIDAGLVSIIAVIHKHRDPDVWQRRLTQP